MSSGSMGCEYLLADDNTRVYRRREMEQTAKMSHTPGPFVHFTDHQTTEQAIHREIAGSSTTLHNPRHFHAPRGCTFHEDVFDKYATTG
jgi:hypothetical protein